MKLSLHFALLIISIVRISAPCCANNPSEQLISLANGLMPEAKNNFTLTHDLSSISIKDSRGHEWDGGYYTQNPVVKLRLLSTETEVSYVRVAIEKCNGIVRADYTYKFLEDAVKDNSKDIDITTLNNGESVEYDVSIPGRYCLAYCAIDVYNNPFYTGEIRFDSLYDDGNWSICGQAELSSGVLSSDNHLSHVFSSNGSGFMEEPGDFIWQECPIVYPYYSGEPWSAPIEYNPILKSYRIVNPFTCNMKFEDYIPEDEDLLCSFYSNVAYSPEGFIFDRKNPTWFLLNAESEIYTYCEPIRTGIVTLHRENPYCYMAHPYNQTIGYVIYDVCPIQNIKETGRYIDMPLEDECNASLIVNFPRWTTSVSDIDNDLDEKFEYFTIYGLKTFGLQKGINIVKRGIKISKVIY